MDINTRGFNSWLLIVCPIGMMLMFAILDPLIIGGVGESYLLGEEITIKDRALADLELFNDKKMAGYLINIFGILFMVGTISGLALLGKALKGTGIALGTLSSLIFTAVLSIPFISMGLSLAANEFFAGEVPLYGSIDTANASIDIAVSLELISEAVFLGVPMFWGIGYTLLGLGMILEKGPLPTVLAWLLFLGGLGMIPGAFIGSAGFLIFTVLVLVVVVSGVFLLRRSDGY